MPSPFKLPISGKLVTDRELSALAELPDDERDRWLRLRAAAPKGLRLIPTAGV